MAVSKPHASCCVRTSFGVVGWRQHIKNGHVGHGSQAVHVATVVGPQNCDTVSIQVVVCSQLGCVLLPVYPVVPHDMQLAVQHSAGHQSLGQQRRLRDIVATGHSAKHEGADLDSTCMPG